MILKNNFSHFLITGANGFIGRRLSEHLKSLGVTVTAVLRKQDNALDKLWDQVIIHDFNNDNNFSKHLTNLPNKKIEAIVHLANIAHNDGHVNFENYWNTNVTSTLDLLDFAVSSKAKSFLYLSSVKAVKTPKNNICVDESYNMWPSNQDFYGTSKRIAEELVQRFTNHNNHNLHTTILRPSLVYGEDVKGHLRLLINAAKKQLLPNLPNINNKRSMVHIDDLVNAILIAINHPNANKKIFIVSDNIYYSTKEICSHIKNQIAPKKPLCWLSNIRIPYLLLKIIAKLNDLLQVVFKKYLPDRFCFNSNALDKMFGSSCFSSEKIQTTIDWHPKHTFFDQKI